MLQEQHTRVEGELREAMRLAAEEAEARCVCV